METLFYSLNPHIILTNKKKGSNIFGRGTYGCILQLKTLTKVFSDSYFSAKILKKSTMVSVCTIGSALTSYHISGILFYKRASITEYTECEVST